MARTLLIASLNDMGHGRFRGICLAAYVSLAFPGVASAQQPEDDPFASVAPRPAPVLQCPAPSWEERLFSENFGWRWEVMSQFSANWRDSAASRQSAGFEVLKKFSSDVKTFAALNFQGRLVWREGFVGTLNDMEGAMRPGWFLEYHNAYADLYNVFDPFLSEGQQTENVGRFNVRLGRFYVPFGLNLQTDTHGTVLQLSNERNFGFERDWAAGLWGNLGRLLRYDVQYLIGSGYRPEFEGQGGLGVGRIGLANRFLSDYGVEGGVSVAYGGRLDPEAVARSPVVRAEAAGTERVRTLRIGVDGRYRHAVPTGLLTWSYELSGGTDASDTVFTQLHELEYLHASRRLGLATQLRWFWQNMSQDAQLAPSNPPRPVDSSLLAEATWYFSNDPAGSRLHWLKANVELQLGRQQGPRSRIWTLQYYLYF